MANLHTCTFSYKQHHGRFTLEASFTNGGYALLDDVVIAGKTAPAIPTNLSENTRDIDPLVFPNPSATKKITLGGNSIKSIIITDNLGRQWPAAYCDNGNNTIDIDLENFAAGVYHVTAVTTTGAFNKKIVLE